MKAEFSIIKEPKKKYYSQLDEFDKFQMKILNLKKAQVTIKFY